jgi:hypothetical protein
VHPAVVLCDIPRYEGIHVEQLDQGSGPVDPDADPAEEDGGWSLVEVIWVEAWDNRLSGRIALIQMP